MKNAISSSISDFAPPGKDGAALRKHMRKAGKIAESIAKRALSAGIKVLTLNILDTQDLTNLVEKTVSDLASDVVEDRIKDYEKGKSEIEDFRKALTSLTDELGRLNSDSVTKVVIIVDELDRCRPTYAIQLLERIKHLFDVPGVVFILGIDRSQLIHSICSLYGEGFNAQGYLRRFIDIDYRLPEPKPGDYCSYLFRLLGIEELILQRRSMDPSRELTQLKTLLSCLMSAAGMSLREQEQTISRLRIVLQTIPRDHCIFEISLGILLFLREWDINIYEAIFSGELNIDNFLSKIDSISNIKDFSDQLNRDLNTPFLVDRDLIEAVLLKGLSELNKTHSVLQNYREIYNSDSNDLKSDKARRIINIIDLDLSNPYHRGAGFKVTGERLALASNFVSYETNDGS